MYHTAHLIVTQWTLYAVLFVTMLRRDTNTATAGQWEIYRLSRETNQTFCHSKSRATLWQQITCSEKHPLAYPSTSSELSLALFPQDDSSCLFISSLPEEKAQLFHGSRWQSEPPGTTVAHKSSSWISPRPAVWPNSADKTPRSFPCLDTHTSTLWMGDTDHVASSPSC